MQKYPFSLGYVDRREYRRRVHLFKNASDLPQSVYTRDDYFANKEEFKYDPDLAQMLREAYDNLEQLKAGINHFLLCDTTIVHLEIVGAYAGVNINDTRSLYTLLQEVKERKPVEVLFAIRTFFAVRIAKELFVSVGPGTYVVIDPLLKYEDLIRKAFEGWFTVAKEYLDKISEVQKKLEDEVTRTLLA